MASAPSTGAASGSNQEAVAASTGTPKATIDKLNADVGKVLATAEVKDRLATFGFEPYIGPPSELTKAMERVHACSATS